MGFYSPSVLVQDAQRHGVEMRSVDVTVSASDCTLERDDAGKASVRLGLCMVKGLTDAGAKRIVEAREARPFGDVSDLARRAALNRRDLANLAAAGALAALAGHRRNAHWLVAGTETGAAGPHLLNEAARQESLPFLEAPREGEDIAADYRSLGLTLGRHPLALLRGKLKRMRLASAEELRAMPNGKAARTAGIVTCRQRPGTAQGVVFVTIEDETGYTNIVVWNDLVERQRKELLGARLLGVEGYMQKEGEVVHLVARRLIDHSVLLGRLITESRDFH
jgi:error-prone DNA polymerase